MSMENATRKGGSKVKKRAPRFNTGSTMKNLWKCLARDFRSTLSDPTYFQDAEMLLNNSIAEYREFKYPRRYLAKTEIVKRDYQLESLFKRFKFLDDTFSDSELEDLTTQKFLDTQHRISVQQDLPLRSILVIRRARKHVSRILGRYSPEEHRRLCKFGSRAAAGVSLKSSGLDQRLETLSGSLEHIKWFKSLLADDLLLARSIMEIQGVKTPEEIRYTVCEKLRLAVVPKSWKSGRTIMPNSQLGGFWSFGLGQLIAVALKSEGLDISRLQNTHRKYASWYSKSRSHVTADLSSASDSFTKRLVMQLLPRKWWTVCSLGRNDQFTYQLDGSEHTAQLQSFMTMGLGYTFQLQTLLFYCLLKAIGDLSGIQGRISVYGDDLVYPTPLHGFVCQVFTDIGFILNMEKTYVKENFRESCGADCYCGTDVRPFQPEGTAQNLSPTKYACFIYKQLNGLLRRWKKEDIPSTYHYLLNEVLRVDDGIMQVPDTYPDYSGLRVDAPKTPSAGEPFYPLGIEPDMPGKPYYFGFTFKHYGQTSRGRAVSHQRCYLWNTLRSRCVVDEDPPLYYPSLYLKTNKSIQEHLETTYETPIDVLKWERVFCRPWKGARNVRGERQIFTWHLVPSVPERGGERYNRQSSTASSWLTASPN